MKGNKLNTRQDKVVSKLVNHLECVAVFCQSKKMVKVSTLVYRLKNKLER